MSRATRIRRVGASASAEEAEGGALMVEEASALVAAEWDLLAESSADVDVDPEVFRRQNLERLAFLDNDETDTQLTVWRDRKRKRLVISFRGLSARGSLSGCVSRVLLARLEVVRAASAHALCEQGWWPADKR